jgi:2-C-methyl-D-erythritol 2,4-cyclodiphosphate synthase
MLHLAVRKVHQHGLRVVNVDVTVVSETPKISAHRDAMRAHLAEALGITPSQVGVKGKTNERMGWIGRGEGLACIAVALVATSEGDG